MNERSTNRKREAPKKILLHTLYNRSAIKAACDFTCECGIKILYDWVCDGMFCPSYHYAFTRELLDAWMSDVSGLAMFFRDVLHLEKKIL